MKAKYQHGLKQGTPLSCLMANIIISLKHKVWQLKTSDIVTSRQMKLKDATVMMELIGGYNFGRWDMEEDRKDLPQVTAQGFCDDNYKYNAAKKGNFKKLIKDMKLNIRMAGQLSLVFKIG